MKKTIAIPAILIMLIGAFATSAMAASSTPNGYLSFNFGSPYTGYGYSSYAYNPYNNYATYGNFDNGFSGYGNYGGYGYSPTPYSWYYDGNSGAYTYGYPGSSGLSLNVPID